MGIAQDLGLAYAKSQMAAQPPLYHLPAPVRVVYSISDVISTAMRSSRTAVFIRNDDAIIQPEPCYAHLPGSSIAASTAEIRLARFLPGQPSNHFVSRLGTAQALVSSDENRLERVLTELWEEYGIEEDAPERETSGIKRLAIMHDDGVNAFGFKGDPHKLLEWMSANERNGGI
jgi:hypothetical protein